MFYMKAPGQIKPHHELWLAPGPDFGHDWANWTIISPLQVWTQFKSLIVILPGTFSSSRPTLCGPVSSPWHCISTRGRSVPHGAPRTRRAPRHPPPPRADRAAGASGLVQGISCPQREELPVQETAVAPTQRPAVHTAAQDRLPDQEPGWVQAQGQIHIEAICICSALLRSDLTRLS